MLTFVFLISLIHQSKHQQMYGGKWNLTECKYFQILMLLFFHLDFIRCKAIQTIN